MSPLLLLESSFFWVEIEELYLPTVKLRGLRQLVVVVVGMCFLSEHVVRKTLHGLPDFIPPIGIPITGVTACLEKTSVSFLF